MYTGVSWAWVNVNKESFHGWQYGIVNVSQGEFVGFQSSWILNYSKKVTGLQMGLVNYAEELHGVQIGLDRAAQQPCGTSALAEAAHAVRRGLHRW